MLIGRTCELIVVPGSRHRYFSCQPGHGTLIKPEKATACAASAGGFGSDDGSEDESEDSDMDV